MLERFMADDTDIGSLHAYACGLVHQLPRYQPGCPVSYSTNPPSAPPLSDVLNRDRGQAEEPGHLGVGCIIEIHPGSQRRQRRKYSGVKKKITRTRRTRKTPLAGLNSPNLG